jgi:hypothetical protein
MARKNRETERYNTKKVMDRKGRNREIEKKTNGRHNEFKDVRKNKKRKRNKIRK